MLKAKVLKNSLVGVASLERQDGAPTSVMKTRAAFGELRKVGTKVDQLWAWFRGEDWLSSRGWHLMMVTRSILSQQATWRTEMGQASVVATLLPRLERKPSFPRSQMWSGRTLSLRCFGYCFAEYCLTDPSRQMKGAVPRPQSFPRTARVCYADSHCGWRTPFFTSRACIKFLKSPESLVSLYQTCSFVYKSFQHYFAS